MTQEKDTSPANESPDMTPQQTSQSSQLPTEGADDEVDTQPQDSEGQSSDAPVTG